MAKASARPITMQLVIIKLKHAQLLAQIICDRSQNLVYDYCREAIIVIWLIILTLLGILFLITEMNRFEKHRLQ